MKNMRTEQELAQAIAGAEGALRIIGGGTRDVGRPVEGELLSVAGLCGVELYEPGALTLVVRAGTPVAEVEALLAAEGQRLPFEPMDHRALLGTQGTPTIGGVIAANVSGPRRIQVGAARDFCLGVRFVDGRGQVLSNGGRVMKNVTGYDLVKLMAGSWGTLGVLSEVSLKLLAVSETEATLVIRGLAPGAAVAALSSALGSPWDITGAAHLALGDGETRVRIEGLAQSVAYRARRLGEEICAGWELVEGAASAALWQGARDVAAFAKREVVWRISVKPTDGPRLSAALREAGLGHEVIYDWGGGLMWLAPEGGHADGGAALIREHVARLGGHARLEKGSRDLRGSVPVFQPEAAPVGALSAKIRAQFDPRGILNPGLMRR
jgi:glycolate oxidase FAD binding subunit